MSMTTGLYMWGRGMMGGQGSPDPTTLVTFLAVKVVVSFLFVWLCVWLLNRWNMAPFNRQKKR